MWPLSHFHARSLVFVKIFDDDGRPDIPFENKTMRAGFLQGFIRRQRTMLG